MDEPTTNAHRERATERRSVELCDIERHRRATPGAASRIHLNNAGASMPTTSVVDTVVEHLRLEQEVGPYEAAEMRLVATAAMYDNAAALIGADPGEIAYCDSATRAWNQLVYSLVLEPGDRILVSAIDYGGSLLAMQHVAQRSGAELVVAPSDPLGRIDVDALSSADLRRTAVIATTHVAAHSGVANPVVELGEIAREFGSLYVLDATQSIGALPVDVATIGCHALTATGRKWLRGPRGTGFMYVSSSIQEALDPLSVDLASATMRDVTAHTSPRIDYRDDARRFEVWERSIATQIGLGRALADLLEIGSDAVETRVLALAGHLAEALRSIPEVEVWNAPTCDSGIVGFTSDRLDATRVRRLCTDAGVNMTVMSNQVAPYDFLRRGRAEVVRLSPHYFNLESEIDFVSDLVRRATAA